VQNDPVNFVDPMGLNMTSVTCSIVAKLFEDNEGGAPYFDFIWQCVTETWDSGRRDPPGIGDGVGGRGRQNTGQDHTRPGLGNPEKRARQEEAYNKCWAREVENLKKEFRPALERIMSRNLRNTVIGGVGAGSLVSLTAIRRGGIGIGIGVIGPLWSWLDDVQDFEREQLGPARESAKEKCRKEAGL
jgi:hypothetical protein